MNAARKIFPETTPAGCCPDEPLVARSRATVHPLVPGNRPTSRHATATAPSLRLALQVFVLVFALLMAWSEFRHTHAAMPTAPEDSARVGGGGVACQAHDPSSTASGLQRTDALLQELPTCVM